MKKSLKKLKKQVVNKLLKVKTQVVKKLLKVKEYLIDQSFYAKQALAFVLEVVLKTTKYSLLTILMVVSAFSAQDLHSHFIESYVGDNTLYIHSPAGAVIQGSGTAFEVVAPSGKVYTLTNAHVCGLAKDGIVMVEDKLHSKRLLPKRVIEVYQDNDLCLVEGLEGYSGLKLADSITVGEHLWAVGYPLGKPMNISSGRVKGFGNVYIANPEMSPADCVGKDLKVEVYPGFFGDIELCVMRRYAAQTDIPTFPGNSGSAAVNMFGNVAGVIFASNTMTNWGEAVPLSFIQDLLKGY